MSNALSSRRVMEDLLRDLRRGPSFTFAGWGQMTVAQQDLADAAVRAWLDAWVLPRVEHLQKTLLPPTPAMRRRAELIQARRRAAGLEISQ